jgi:succinate-semialdehyde dehydrogenase/glutarate-semialdehyde dehydrogenase
LKPASQTPFSALALAELAERAGVPKGVFNVLTGSATEIGGELTSNPTVRKLSFTGSTEIGKILMAQCAGTVKKLSLELGGNAPLIVFDDADLDAAVEGTIASKYRNTGQTCVCTNRVLVDDSVYDSFATKLAVAVKALKPAPGLEPAPRGTADDDAAVRRKLYSRSAIKGAGSRGRASPCARRPFFEPTILTGVTPQMAVARKKPSAQSRRSSGSRNRSGSCRPANDTEFVAAYFTGGRGPHLASRKRSSAESWASTPESFRRRSRPSAA